MEITVASPKTGTLANADGCAQPVENLVRDEKALYEQLIAPLESQMMRSIWRVVRHLELAEDTLQDALAIIWSKRRRIQSHPNPQALILKICLNAACDTLRKRARFRKEEDSYRLHKFSGSSDAASPRALERKEIEDEVLKAMSRLPKKQAMAVFMRIVQDHPYGVIAQAMGCRETTARIHVSRGRARLSQWLSHLVSTSSREVSK